MISWTEKYVALAHHIAGWSKDPTTQVGAVLVGRDPRQIALGYNGFPPGVHDTPERLADRDLKHLLTQHAERNVLDNAHFDVQDSMIVTTRFPCVECAKSMISKRVGRIVCPDPSGDTAHTDPKWARSSEAAMMILHETGVKIFYVLEGGRIRRQYKQI